MRAPSYSEALQRARSLIPALVNAVGTQASVLRGEQLVSLAPANVSSEACHSIATQQRAGGGVRTRSMASDSVVLCMQTLRFLLAWPEQPISSSSVASGGSTGGSSRSASSSGNTANAATDAAAATDANATSSGTPGSAGPSESLGQPRGASRASEGANSGLTGRPFCHHGYQTRVSPATGEAGNGDQPAESLAFYVCPLGRSGCNFKQPVQQSVR